MQPCILAACVLLPLRHAVLSGLPRPISAPLCCARPRPLPWLHSTPHRILPPACSHQGGLPGAHCVSQEPADRLSAGQLRGSWPACNASPRFPSLCSPCVLTAPLACLYQMNVVTAGPCGVHKATSSLSQERDRAACRAAPRRHAWGMLPASHAGAQLAARQRRLPGFTCPAARPSGPRRWS